jgi:predicted secreted protein
MAPEATGLGARIGRVRARRAAIVGLTLLLAALLGCGGQPDHVVAPGGSFEITVEANPSTGYAWRVARYPDELLDEPTSRSSKPPEGVVGAPVEETFTFTAREGAAGEGEVELELLPPGESTPEQTVTESFEVTG